MFFWREKMCFWKNIQPAPKITQNQFSLFNFQPVRDADKFDIQKCDLPTYIQTDRHTWVGVRDTCVSKKNTN